MYIRVKVTAGAKKEMVEKISDTSYKVSVKEPAKMNLANKRVTQMLAEKLKVPAKAVRLINGHVTPTKLFSVGDR